MGGEAVEHDVRSIESWERLLQTAGEVDVLVNNAARTEIRSFWEIDVDEWDDVLATNLRGTYLGCRVVGAQMRERGSGRIVNLASVAGQNSRAVTGVHYATSKAAIIALTRHAATELAGSGVTVNAVAPAAIDGPMVATVAPERLRGDAEDDPGRPARPTGRSGGRRRLPRLGRSRLRHRRDPRRQRRDVDAMRTRAAVMHEPGRLEVEELDVEEPLPGEVVVRMSAVGVCGTDLHSYKGEWDRPTPIVLGHEGTGVVEAVGGDVAALREGDRVVLSWAPACGECGPCRRGRPAACGPLSSAIGKGTLLGGRTGLSLGGETVYRGTATGALAEHVVVAAGAAMPLADDVPLEHAALLGCAALTGVGAVLNAARPEPGFTALVIGAGGVGQFVVQGARIAGAAEVLVVDPVEARREQALGLGATRACAPDDLRGGDEGARLRGSRLRLRRGRRAGDDEARAPLDARRRHRRRGRPAGRRREARARPVRVLEPREDADRERSTAPRIRPLRCRG